MISGSSPRPMSTGYGDSERTSTTTGSVVFGFSLICCSRSSLVAMTWPVLNCNRGPTPRPARCTPSGAGSRPPRSAAQVWVAGLEPADDVRHHLAGTAALRADSRPRDLPVQRCAFGEKCLVAGGRVATGEQRPARAPRPADPFGHTDRQMDDPQPA